MNISTTKSAQSFLGRVLRFDVSSKTTSTTSSSTSAVGVKTGGGGGGAGRIQDVPKKKNSSISTSSGGDQATVSPSASSSPSPSPPPHHIHRHHQHPNHHHHIHFDVSANKVIYVPSRNDYSKQIQKCLWTSMEELKINVRRNRREFAYEKWNWRNVVEEEEMYYDTNSQERIHPIHLGVRSIQDLQ